MLFVLLSKGKLLLVLLVGSFCRDSQAIAHRNHGGNNKLWLIMKISISDSFKLLSRTGVFFSFEPAKFREKSWKSWISKVHGKINLRVNQLVWKFYNIPSVFYTFWNEKSISDRRKYVFHFVHSQGWKTFLKHQQVMEGHCRCARAAWVLLVSSKKAKTRKILQG